MKKDRRLALVGRPGGERKRSVSHWGDRLGILTLDPSLQMGIGIRQMEKVFVCAHAHACLCFLGRRKEKDDKKERSLDCHGNCKYII